MNICMKEFMEKFFPNKAFVYVHIVPSWDDQLPLISYNANICNFLFFFFSILIRFSADCMIPVGIFSIDHSKVVLLL